MTGYRAPSFSIDQRTPWAFMELVEQGYAYSSSVAPVGHDHYGWPEAPRFAFKPLPWAPLVEIPVTTAMFAGKRLAAGGGGFFRVLPYAFSRWAIRQVNRRDERPAMFYFHPWEIDPGQPRVAGAPLKSRLRHYTNLEQMAPKLRQLIREFAWGRMDVLAYREAARVERGDGGRWRVRVNAPFALTSEYVRAADLRQPDEAARIEGFVADDAAAACSTARPGCARSSAAPASARAGWWRRRAGRSPAGCRSSEVHSPVFGRMLASSGFAVEGGVLAEREATATALVPRGRGICRAPVLPDDRAARRRRCPRAAGTRAPTATAASSRRSLADDEAQLLAIPRKQRAEVRKGLENDLEITVGTGAADRADALRGLCRKRAQPRHAGVPARAVRRGARRARRRHPHRAPPAASRWRACCRSTMATRCCPTGAAAPAPRAPCAPTTGCISS